MDNTNALATLEKVALTQKPPVKMSKALLIDAMMLRLKQQHEQEREKRDADRKAAKEKLVAVLATYLKKNTAKITTDSISECHLEHRYYNGKATVTITLPVPLPTEIQVAYDALKAVPAHAHLNEQRMRQEIKESLTFSPKAADILKDKKMVSAIDTALREIGYEVGVTKTIEA